MEQTEVIHGKNKFYIGMDESAPTAQMTYVNSGENLIIIDHTEVGEEHQGKGAGRKLLKELVDWARSENIKIVPLCPYAKVQMEKNDEYRDMLY